MIVSLSQDVCQQLQEIKRIETIKDNTESIRATFEALITLKSSVAMLVNSICLLYDRLPKVDVQSAMPILDRLSRETKISQERFETELRQTKVLSTIQAGIQKLTKEVQSQWQQYATEQLHDAFELLNLVRNLPEVQAHQTMYDELKKRLTDYRDILPSTYDQLADFDQSLHLLMQRLSSIEGLNAEVKIFLQRTLKDEATLVDLTDEVLQWCRQGDHARIFAIRFIR